MAFVDLGFAAFPPPDCKGTPSSCLNWALIDTYSQEAVPVILQLVCMKECNGTNCEGGF